MKYFVNTNWHEQHMTSTPVLHLFIRGLRKNNKFLLSTGLGRWNRHGRLRKSISYIKSQCFSYPVLFLSPRNSFPKVIFSPS